MSWRTIAGTTTYAHFPDERQLFHACSAHWQSQNPFPDPRAWAEIADPRERLAVALDRVYAFYQRRGDALWAIFEGAEQVPAMADAVAGRAERFAALAALLIRGRGARGRRRARLLAAVGHALELGTWRSLAARGSIAARRWP